jgi:Tfp pilus assembly protein PilF
MSTSETHDLLRQGITAAKQGDKTRAREILLRVIELDEKSEPAWLWLSGVATAAIQAAA